MAYSYKKRQTKTRRRSRRSKAIVPWSRKKYCITPADAYTYAKRSFTYLSGLVNSEMHYSSSSNTDVAVSYDNPLVVPLTAIAVGDTATTRTGNSIFVRRLNVNLYIRNENNIFTQTRVMLVRDKQQIGDTTPALSDILATTNSQLAPLSFLNKATAGRFDILYNAVIPLSANSAGAGPAQKVIKINKNMRSHVRYNGTASTDIQRSGLYLYVFSDQSDASTYEPVVDYNYRLNFHDN